MSEDLGKEMAIEAAKAVAVEGYKDTLQPTLKAVGSVIALPFQAIDAALSKPKLWVAEKQYNYERTRQLLAEKLQYTPEELIVPPENYVAVPALQQIAYCFDSDELRDMYANLLANSMNKVVKNGVHPGFVEIIKQLSPDEAKIIRYLSVQNRIPTLGLKIEKADSSHIVYVKEFSNVPELSMCENTYDSQKYFDNLVRLGLVERSPDGTYISNENAYETLKKHPFIKNKYQNIEKQSATIDNFSKIDYIKGYCELTAFGKSFCSICLETQKVFIINSQESGN